NQVNDPPAALMKAEADCRYLIEDLLRQRSEWAPGAYDATRADEGLDTLPLPPVRIDLLVANQEELGEAWPTDIEAPNEVSRALFRQLGLTAPPPRVQVEGTL